MTLRSARLSGAPARIETIAEICYRLVDDYIWSFARDRAAEIDAHWQQRSAQNPHLYNGRVLLMHRREGTKAASQRRLDGTCFLADYKAFIAWRDFGCPDATIVNVFAMGALRSADGAFLLGEMGPTTASAGRVYFPAGTPDPNDLKDGWVDLEGSVRRELKEETGLDPAGSGGEALRLEPGWTVVFQGASVACMKTIRSALSAAELVGRVDAFLAREKDPELVRLRPVFTAADLDPVRMPEFMRAYLHHIWRAETAAPAHT